MPLPDNDGDFGSWEVQGSSVHVRIEYALPALERAASEAVDGLYRFRHGGAEVGGVLYGSVAANGVVRVDAIRHLECEYAFGPRFVLSDRDKTNLAGLVEAYERDPELAGLYPVGWYHSHTRSGIELSPRDLEIYERFFPERWQVALVLRPEQYGPVRAGFFFRERNRSIRAGESYEDFMIGMRRRTAPVDEAPEPEAPEAEQPAAAEPEYVEPEPDAEWAPEPAVGESTPESEAEDEPAAESEPAREYVVEPDPEPIPEMPDFAPAFYTDEPKARRKWPWVAAVVAVVALGVAAWFYFFAGAKQPISLMVTDVGGQLLIEWDRTAKPIREARTAVLEIKDGDSDLRRIVLDSDTLHGGSADYTRQANVVDVALIVDQQGGGARDTLRFIGPPVKRNPSPEELQVVRERDQLKSEVDRLRGEIEKRDAQNSRRGGRRP